MAIKIFVGEHCGPCHEIEKLINEGKVETDIEGGIEVIDIETEKGFPEVVKEELRSIPAAKYKGKFCRLEIDEDAKILIISCKKEDSPEQSDQDRGKESSDS